MQAQRSNPYPLLNRSGSDFLKINLLSSDSSSSLSVFISIFCYLLMPDRTPDANRMCLPITTQSPGFKATFLLIKKSTAPEETGFPNRTFFGGKSSYDQIPIRSYRNKVAARDPSRHSHHTDGNGFYICRQWSS